MQNQGSPSKKAAKKAAKPVAKKAAPAPKKPAKPAKAAKKAVPAPKTKGKVVKPVAKKTPKKEEKPVKKAAPKTAPAPVSKKKETEPEKKPKTVAVKNKETKPVKPSKKEDKEKKVKPPVDEDIAGEDWDMEDGLLEADVEVEGVVIDDEDELLEEEEPKKGKGRKRKEKSEEKKHYDSESYVRKQVVKIDLSRSLIKKNQQDQPKPFVNTNDNRTRYSDAELAEFKELILQKLAEAKADYDLLKQTLSHADDHGTDDTSPTFKLLEDGSDVLSKEETAQLAARQEKYIINLQNALVRIENKTYGVCRVTGKLIPKERLRSVPHATLSIDAKLNQNH